MTPSILEMVGLNCKDKNSKELEHYLHEELNIYIFDAIFRKFHSTDNEAKYMIWYILYAYTEESPFLILNAESHKEKLGICDRLGMPEYIRDKVINLNDEIVRHIVTEYVDYLAGYDFRTLQFMKIQYDDISSMIIKKEFHKAIDEEVKNDLGEKVVYTKSAFDEKSYFNAVSKVENLGKRIADLEKKLSSQHKWKFTPEMKELKKKEEGRNESGRRNIAPEASSHIN